ncbi:MAG: hypothetical protein ATN31_00025 [Candidatus Epulonipiscioides saccharophilum]|nr:MAG: hypothetical protein ATN31_00025 [Epulopiscium sp. AS2M-Bin001]
MNKFKSFLTKNKLYVYIFAATLCIVGIVKISSFLSEPKQLDQNQMIQHEQLEYDDTSSIILDTAPDLTVADQSTEEESPDLVIPDIIAEAETETETEIEEDEITSSTIIAENIPSTNPPITDPVEDETIMADTSTEPEEDIFHIEDPSSVSAISETISTTQEEILNFNQGDHFQFPVEGDIIVPYKDDSTDHWWSAFKNTMRTLGICLAAEPGTEVKAVADGIVVDILDDYTELSTTINVGNVGHLMVIDHGNGYKSIYGFQGGTPDVSLIGETVESGDTIGFVGAAKGPFIDQPSNIYLQVTKNGEVINPETLLNN